MVPPVEIPSTGGRAWIARAASLVLLIVVLAGCGSTLKGNQANAGLATIIPTSGKAASCPATVVNTLASVLDRVYREGVVSERTASAQYMVTHSRALREAVETGNKPAAEAAAAALLATGHLTNLRITRGGQTFISAGGSALSPLRGTLLGASGSQIGSYVTSVWADNGFLIEAAGITQGEVDLRADGRSIYGSLALPPGALSKEGALIFDHVTYQFSSLPASTYPTGTARIYLLIPVSSTHSLCGRTSEDTTVNTLKHVADRIYTGESGDSARKQIRRVQQNKALLEAVAQRNPAATELAIKALLNHHIVRLRVSAGGELLSDVGGPYVLAPVSAPLTLHGHTIGSFVLSIQDDEGYLRLTRRLAGLKVLMYMSPGNQLVKNSLGPVTGEVPASGSYSYNGKSFRVFTVHAKEFPSGPLTIRVLVPLPYS
ncbi:MAG: hypothetical protein ABR992_05535 [Solirubrobacteraceae bacterium]|jgi:hypothetical protein